MNKQFKQVGDVHIVITRFNINVNYSVVKTKILDEINPATDDTYLSRRFELFERYTVPSMQQQTSQDFIWLVMFHEETPAKYREKIAKLAQEYPVFCPVFLSHTQDHLAFLTDYLRGLDASRYITTRIDNDDAFHCSYIQTVQTMAQADTNGDYAILFSNGLQYHEKQQFASIYYFERNHFSTLVAQKTQDKPKNILEYNHMLIADVLPVKQVNCAQPMWLELIHDSNVSNRMHVARKQIVRDVALLEGFGVSLPLVKHAVAMATFYALLKKPINAVRLLKMYGLKGCLMKAHEKIKR